MSEITISMTRDFALALDVYLARVSESATDMPESEWYFLEDFRKRLAKKARKPPKEQGAKP